MFEFEKQDDLLRNLQLQYNILSTVQLSTDSVFVFYNFRDSVLVPEQFHNEANNGTLLDLMFGKTDDCFLAQDKTETNKIVNVYRVPEQVHHWFMLHFPNCEFVHSSSRQAAEIRQDINLRCIVSYGNLKIIFSQNGQLQLIQQFSYSSPEDALYHLIRVCESHGCKPEDVKLELFGLLTPDSGLYQLIYNYFSTVELGTGNVTALEGENDTELPAHYFSHLIELAS